MIELEKLEYWAKKNELGRLEELLGEAIEDVENGRVISEEQMWMELESV